MKHVFTEELRQSVEASSGGRQTVLRTAKGQATYMTIIPQVRVEELHPTAMGTGPHPAFLVNGVEKREILIGSYQAVISDGEALSLPSQDPAANVTFDAAREVCRAAGDGFHLMTNLEWALLALLSAANGHDVRGNTNRGKSHSHPEEKGTLANRGGITLTGSGPASWRHDGSMFGVSDLVGNIWEWVDGVKLVSGQIVMPADNDFKLPEQDWTRHPLFLDGVDRLQASNEVTMRGWISKPFRDVRNVGIESSKLLQAALLCGIDGMGIPGHFWADNSDGFEALPFRGGFWCLVSLAGLGALSLVVERSVVGSSLGFRPAFIG